MKEELSDFEKYVELGEKLLELLLKEDCTTVQAVRSLTVAFGRLAMSINLSDEMLNAVSEDIKKVRDILKEEKNNDNE